MTGRSALRSRLARRLRFALLVFVGGIGAFVVGTQMVARRPVVAVHPLTGRAIPGMATDVGWLDRAQRDREELPDRLLELIGISSGMTVADIGAGTGYMTLRIARLVGPAGKVYANDVQPAMLRQIRAKLDQQRIGNVEVIQGVEDDARLPVNAVDLALLVDVYHELRQPQPMLRSIGRSLRPHGRLVIVEYRREDSRVPVASAHRMSVADTRTEVEAEGFIHELTIDELPRQHVFVFRAPRPAARRMEYDRRRHQGPDTRTRMSQPRPTADALLARLSDHDRARLRIYIGAAPGVGKTYAMLQEAHALRARGLDVVVGMVETYGRRDTEAQLKDLEVIPRRKVEYRGVTLEEMDVDAIIRRRPQVCVVDELAHTNVPGSRNEKRFQDVLDLLNAGIHVMTAVNIQHLETLNDAVARTTGIRVRETVPDTFLDRADEVINVDVTVEELRSRLREGKIYKPEKVEQALTNFFRKGNLSTLRELALRAVADEVGEKAASYREREGLEPARIPERVMVCMSSNAHAPRVIRAGARIAGRLGSTWYAVYVETPEERPDHIKPDDADALRQNIQLAESLGATVVRVKAARPADGLIAFAQREGVTHVIFGQSARSRWEQLWRGSTLDRFLSAIPDATVQVVPLNDA